MRESEGQLRDPATDESRVSTQDIDKNKMIQSSMTDDKHTNLKHCQQRDNFR